MHGFQQIPDELALKKYCAMNCAWNAGDEKLRALRKADTKRKGDECQGGDPSQRPCIGPTDGPFAAPAMDAQGDFGAATPVDNLAADLERAMDEGIGYANPSRNTTCARRRSCHALYVQEHLVQPQRPGHCPLHHGSHSQA